jgi:hypothetical protein
MSTADTHRPVHGKLKATGTRCSSRPAESYCRPQGAGCGRTDEVTSQPSSVPPDDRIYWPACTTNYRRSARLGEFDRVLVSSASEPFLICIMPNLHHG